MLTPAACAPILALLFTASPPAPANPHLARATELLSRLDFEKAAAELDRAWAAPDNDRATVLKILELQAVAAGTRNHPAKAREAFTRLLVLEPGFQLDSRATPRVATPFLEAKAIARERGPLTLEAAGRAEGLAPLPALSVRVGRDALNLARAVRFFVATAGGARASVQPLSDGAASVEAPQGAFTWWAELLGERRAVLLALKSEAEPFRVTLEPEPKALAPAQATAAAQPAVTLQVEPAPPRLRPLAWTLLGLGAASAVVGGVFGLEANLAWSRLNGATRDGAGAITGLTRTDALELDRGLRRDALIANVTLISAAALLALGLLVFWLGGS